LVIVGVHEPGVACPAYCPACHLDLDPALRDRIHQFGLLLAVLAEEKQFTLSFRIVTPPEEQP